MTDWTLGAVEKRNMLLEAHCQTESCRRFFTFDLAKLIASVGADFLVSDIPKMSCEVCGGPLEIKLAMKNLGSDEIGDAE